MTRFHIVLRFLAAASLSAFCSLALAGFSENPTLPRMLPIVQQTQYDIANYALASTANPGTFVVMPEITARQDTFTDPGDYRTRWNDVLTVRAYCYETNTEARIVLTTWKQGPGYVVPGGLPKCYHRRPPTSCPYTDPEDLSVSAYQSEGWGILEAEKVDITKDAIPPAAGQPYGKLYASVQLHFAQYYAAETLVYVFEISRNTAGQPTIVPVAGASGTCAPGPVMPACGEGCEGLPPCSIGEATIANNPVTCPGLIRWVNDGTPYGCTWQWENFLSHAISVHKRTTGSSTTYEAWLWWEEEHCRSDLFDDWQNQSTRRLYGYRVDQSTVSGRWTVSQAPNGPKMVDVVDMDACLDPVGNRTGLQISWGPADLLGNETASVEACWFPTNFGTGATEAAFYTPDLLGYNDTACTPFGAEIPLVTNVSDLLPGSIDSMWQPGSAFFQGAYCDGSGYTHVYRIVGSGLVSHDILGYQGSNDVRLTCFGNPFAASQFGKSGTTALNNPHGAVLAAFDYGVPVSISLWENAETPATLKLATKNIPLSQNSWEGEDTFTQVDLTKDNIWPRIAQVKKRLDQSAGNMARDRELFYTWIGVDALGQRRLVIKHSGTQAFRFGINNRSDTYQWVNNNLEWMWGGPIFFGSSNWLSGYYNHGALLEFRENGLPYYHSGDQIFNAVFEGYAGQAYDGRNGRYASNELLPYHVAQLGLVDNPYDYNDPTYDKLINYLEAGQNGWQSVDVSSQWNFFALRPWDYNYFHVSVPESGYDEGAVLTSAARLWCYWLDWQ